MGRLKTEQRVLTVLLVTMSLGLSTGAWADTVDIVHDGYGAYSELDVWAAGHSGDTAFAGVYMLNKTSGTGVGETWSNGLIPGFCIELEEPAPQATYTYDVGMPDDAYNSYLDDVMGSEKANYLRELWDMYYDSSWASGGSYTSTQNTAAAAFAAAVWEIIYEDLPTSVWDYDVTVDGTVGDGGFYADGIATETANKWLHTLTGTGGKADLLVVSYGGQQDYLVAVPEPATLLLLGLGGSFGLCSRHRRGRAIRSRSRG